MVLPWAKVALRRRQSRCLYQLDAMKEALKGTSKDDTADIRDDLSHGSSRQCREPHCYAECVVNVRTCKHHNEVIHGTESHHWNG